MWQGSQNATLVSVGSQELWSPCSGSGEDGACSPDGGVATATCRFTEFYGRHGGDFRKNLVVIPIQIWQSEQKGHSLVG